MPVRPHDLTSVLRARIAAARDVDRAASVHTRARLDAFVRGGEAPTPTGAAIWLFGSLSSGDFGVASDVDLGVEGFTIDEALQFGVAAERALGRTVEVLRLEALPSDFAARIRREGVRLR